MLLKPCIWGTEGASCVRQPPAIAKTFRCRKTGLILYVVALGKPVETVVLEKIKPDLPAGKHQIPQRRSRTHYVPKRSLEELIIEP